ncbi:uncharacterized protein LOC111942201 [Cyanistes caeruleus]|uniref:uncharacterized protein LOC111942201 n=1 Tax=Cyanistes caeruleus TaxID=156563 RepID=UPI000CDA0FA2|nr:uncharacterized protein LOC111942201 [Cyanistes caeruleus]XP_023801151.1 uncharacterized protein LOC111942201 [Cyanistes caeruleus]
MAAVPEVASATTKMAARKGGSDVTPRTRWLPDRGCLDLPRMAAKKAGKWKDPGRWVRAIDCLTNTPAPTPLRRNFPRLFRPCGHGLCARRRRGRAPAGRAPTGSGEDASLCRGPCRGRVLGLLALATTRTSPPLLSLRSLPLGPPPGNGGNPNGIGTERSLPGPGTEAARGGGCSVCRNGESGGRGWGRLSTEYIPAILPLQLLTALKTCVLRGVYCPAGNDSLVFGALSHTELCGMAGSASVVAPILLKDSSAQPVRAWRSLQASAWWEMSLGGNTFNPQTRQKGLSTRRTGLR